MMLAKALASASASAPKVYVEDVFSTWLYTGNGSTQTITNGIDLSGKGGLVWTKFRSGSFGSESHAWIDTARGVNNYLTSDGTAAQVTSQTNVLTAFNSSGYTLGSDTSGKVNSSAQNYASWTFRKAAKFFDVVTYTGDGNTGRAISHSLGSKPGFIIIKRTDAAQDWYTVHRSQNAASPGPSGYIRLNATSAVQDASDVLIDLVNSTSTTFLIGSNAFFNTLNSQYVAYLFAHDAGGFGDSGNDSVVKCGSFTADSVYGEATVTLGWEPQWVLYKSSTAGTAWNIEDSMRSGLADKRYAWLEANSSNAESAGSSTYLINATSTGFKVANASGSATYIYIAIRRGPMKTPTDATTVFSAIKQTSSGKNTTNFALDAQLSSPVVTDDRIAFFANRLTGVSTNSTPLARGLVTSSTAAEGTTNQTTYNTLNWDNTGFDSSPQLPSGSIYWSFRRAPGFFDVVAWTGNGANRTISHNLGVAPELIIVKSRSGNVTWPVYAAPMGNTKTLFLNQTAAQFDNSPFYWNNTNPTSTVFSLGTESEVNLNNATYIAYLFASCPGVSKVGSYTGTGTTLNVDCGFTNGARFVLIKRADGTGDWYVWDSARGIVSGNDSYLLLNSTAAEVTNTDYIDPLSSGFQISSTAPAAINANGGSFIYLAVA